MKKRPNRMKRLGLSVLSATVAASVLSGWTVASAQAADAPNPEAQSASSGRPMATLADMAQLNRWLGGTTLAARITEAVIYNSTDYDMVVDGSNAKYGEWKKVEEKSNGTHQIVTASGPSGTIKPGEAASYIIGHIGMGDAEGTFDFRFEKGGQRLPGKASITLNNPFAGSNSYAYNASSMSNRPFDVNATDVYHNVWSIPGSDSGGAATAQRSSSTGFGKDHAAVVGFNFGGLSPEAGKIPPSGLCAAYESGFWKSIGLPRPEMGDIHGWDGSKLGHVWNVVNNKWMDGGFGAAAGYGLGYALAGCFNPVDKNPPPPYADPSDLPTNSKTYTISAMNTGRALDVRERSTADGAPVDTFTPNRADNQQWQVLTYSDGTSRIINENSNKALAVDSAGKVVQLPVSMVSSNQIWRLVPDARGIYYALVNVAVQKTVDVPGSGNGVQLITHGRGDQQSNQMFKFTEFTPKPELWNTYEITSIHSGKSMVVKGGSNAEGAPVIQYGPPGGTANEKWELHFQGSDEVSLRPKHDPSKCAISDGAGKIILYRCDSSQWHPRWTIVPALYGGWKLQYGGNAQYNLDVPGGSYANDVQLKTWVDTGGQNQSWRFTHVTG
ncbi:RICIN domain-containing protein [Streptomyces noursei]